MEQSKERFLIKRQYKKDNGLGTKIKVWESVDAISGLLRPYHGNAQSKSFTSGERGSKITHKLYCDLCDINVGDKIESKGIEYIVLSVYNPMNRDFILQIDLERSTIDGISEL